MSYLKCEFHPQVLEGEHYLPTSPLGEVAFAVSDEEARRLSLHAGDWEEFDSDTFSGDNLVLASTAPAWVQAWEGPFWISVEVIGNLDEVPIFEASVSTQPEATLLRKIDEAMARCVASSGNDADLTYQVLGAVKQAMAGDYRVLDGLPDSD